MKSVLKDLVYAGHVTEQSAEVRKQVLISSLFSLISVLLLFVFSLDSFCAGKQMLAFIVLVSSAINAVNYFYLRKTGRYRVTSYVIVILMALLCLYLVCSGGSSNTGPLWFFVLPTLSFYILGLKRGFIVVTGLFIAVLVLLYLPGSPLLLTEYPLTFIHRFVASLFSVCFIAYVYEYTREDGRKELLAISSKLDNLSREDELTGLSNRRDIIEKIENEKNRFERSGKPFSILVIDIDHFKKVNDRYGHECGDYVLKLVATTFEQKTQKRDGVARWGGEEFLVFLPETGLAHAEKIANRLRRAVANLQIGYGGKMIRVTVSVGATQYQPGQSIKEIINVADQHLYCAKDSGRNRVNVGMNRN